MDGAYIILWRSESLTQDYRRKLSRHGYIRRYRHEWKIELTWTFK
jgi:hypothetical protein